MSSTEKPETHQTDALPYLLKFPAPPARLTPEALEILRAPFPEEKLGIKVQSFSKDRTKAMLVAYIQHTDCYERLEKVDPNWSCQITHEDRIGETFFTRVKLTLCGVSRENTGEGGDPKASVSDAIKRAAMLFGIGRYLYDSEQVWVPYNDQQDRFRSWTLQDYQAALRKGQARLPVGPKEPPAHAATKPGGAPQPGSGPDAAGKGAPQGPIQPPLLKTRPREELNRILMNLYRPYLTTHPGAEFAKILQQRYGLAETRLLTIEQLENFVQWMEAEVQAGGPQAAQEPPKAAQAEAIPLEAIQALSDADLGGYRIPFGKKYKGLRLAELEVGEIRHYLDWLTSEAAKKKKPLSGEALDFARHAEEYIARAEQVGQDEPGASG